MGDENRLRLVSRLCREGPSSISRLTAGSRITRQAVTKHLRVMERARLVHSKKRGRESVWELDHRRIEDSRRYLDLISRQWDSALLRLKDLVEG